LLFDRIEERIEAQPGVVSVGQVTLSPFSGSGWNGTVHAQGAATAEGKESWFNAVGPGYFETMKTPLLAGRDFTTQDTASAPRIAIVNEQFAKVVFGGGNPVGRMFRNQAPAGEPEPEYRVVGMVRNTKYYGLREEFKPIAFVPVAQDENFSDSITYMVRSQVPLGATMAGLRDLMTEMQQGLLIEFRVLDEQVAQSVLRERLMATVSGAFGVLAIVLSAVGLYGVMAYMVARRRNEFGVRLALGASAEHVLALVFSEAGRLVVIGLVCGAVGAYFAARYAQSQLYGLQFNDMRTLAAGCGVLALTGALAALVPALRALRFDPATVLKTE
jgi:predicted permease